MNITKIRLKGPVVVDLPIYGAKPNDPYILKAADGLGPPEVSVFMGPGFSGASTYRGRRPLDREIVLRLGLNPNFGVSQTIGSMREHLYNFFTEEGFRVVLMNGDTEICGVLSYLKRIEINPFTNKPEVQLTIICTQATFNYATAYDSIVPSYTPAQLSALNKLQPVFNNIATAPSPTILSLTLTANVPSLTIKQYSPDEYASVDTFSINTALVSGATITIIGIPGSYICYSLVGSDFSTFTYLERFITSSSKWIKFQPGLNTYTVSTDKYVWETVGIAYEWWGI